MRIFVDKRKTEEAFKILFGTEVKVVIGVETDKKPLFLISLDGEKYSTIALTIKGDTVDVFHYGSKNKKHTLQEALRSFPLYYACLYSNTDTPVANPVEIDQNLTFCEKDFFKPVPYHICRLSAAENLIGLKPKTVVFAMKYDLYDTDIIIAVQEHDDLIEIINFDVFMNKRRETKTFEKDPAGVYAALKYLFRQTFI